jgi:hypothetical protein
MLLWVPGDIGIQGSKCTLCLLTFSESFDITFDALRAHRAALLSEHIQVCSPVQTFPVHSVAQDRINGISS